MEEIDPAPAPIVRPRPPGCDRPWGAIGPNTPEGRAMSVDEVTEGKHVLWG
jgi:hypothetical protein